MYRNPAHEYSILYKNSKYVKKVNLVSVSIGRVQIYWPHNNLVIDGVHGLGTSTVRQASPSTLYCPWPCTVLNVNIIGSSMSSTSSAPVYMTLCDTYCRELYIYGAEGRPQIDGRCRAMSPNIYNIGVEIWKFIWHSLCPLSKEVVFYGLSY